MAVRISDFALNWLAGRIAGQAITISLHTGDPGADGTANELATTGGSNYARKATTAADWTATGATVDNDADIGIFTPNAAAAGQAVTHVGYWFGTDHFLSVDLIAPVTTVEGVAFPIAAGTADITISAAA